MLQEVGVGLIGQRNVAIDRLTLRGDGERRGVDEFLVLVFLDAGINFLGNVHRVLHGLVVPVRTTDAADQALAQFHRDDAGQIFVGLRRVGVLVHEVHAEIALQDLAGARVDQLRCIGDIDRVLLDVGMLGDDRRRCQVVSFLLVRWEPVITYVFPDGASLFNRGFVNDALI